MRPAPTRPRRNRSEATSGEELAVEVLVRDGLGESLGGLGEDVLLDDHPAREALSGQRGEGPTQVDVALTQRAEGLARPDGRVGLAVGDDAIDDLAVRVLDVDVVDPARPAGRQLRRVAPARVEVPGLEAHPDVGQLHGPLDLPGRLDPGPGLGVQCRLVAAVATARENLAQSRAEARPTFGVETA